METFLNLVWLAVTLAAICAWRFRWAGSRENPRYSARMEAVAMVCVLALLFPVISLTDDLHPETAVVDAASGKRNACLIAASAPDVRVSTVAPRLHLLLGTISRPLDLHNPSFANRDTFVELRDSVSLASNSAGRSPPTLL